MVHVTTTAQFNVFDTIRNIILNNSTLNVKFTKHNIFEYEPSKNEFKLPHILIKYPEISNDEHTLGYKPTYSKNFDVEIVIRVGYEARSNMKTYMNSLIEAIENDVTMLALGYCFEEISNSKPEPGDIYEVNAIEATFTVSYKGDVSYG